MNKAHVFQHNTTGVQIFIYHLIEDEQQLKHLCVIITLTINCTSSCVYCRGIHDEIGKLGIYYAVTMVEY